MLVVNRFLVDERERADFTSRAATALAALAARPGYRAGTLGRCVDEPDHWCLVTEWESVGAYRRALGGFEVKVTAIPLLAQSIDEPSAFEQMAVGEPGGAVKVLASDRAADGGRGAGGAG